MFSGVFRVILILQGSMEKSAATVHRAKREIKRRVSIVGAK
jgi:hypothetical protein